MWSHEVPAKLANHTRSRVPAGQHTPIVVCDVTRVSMRAHGDQIGPAAGGSAGNGNKTGDLGQLLEWGLQLGDRNANGPKPEHIMHKIKGYIQSC